MYQENCSGSEQNLNGTGAENVVPGEVSYLFFLVSCYQKPLQFDWS